MALSASKVDVWNGALGRIGHTESIEAEGDTELAAKICRQYYDNIIKEALEVIPWDFARKQSPLSSLASQSTTKLYDAAFSLTNFEIPFDFISSDQISVVKGSTTLVLGTDFSVVNADPAAGTLARVVLAVALGVGESIVITAAISRVGWEYVYALPADCVTPIALLGEGQVYALLPVATRNPFVIMVNDGGTGLLLCTNIESGEGFDVLEYTSVVDYVPMWPRQFLTAIEWRLAEELARSVKIDERTAATCRNAYLVAIDQARVNMRKFGGAGPAPLSPTLAVR